MSTPEAPGTPVAEAIADLETFEHRQVPPDPNNTRYVPPGYRPRGGYQVPGASGADDYETRVAPLQRAETLEDLYALFPKVGQVPGWVLRVHRVLPKVWRNVPLEGYLGDIEERISLDEFAHRFGGGTYKILVRGPGNRTDEVGQPLQRTFHLLEALRLPGDPNPSSLPMREDNMTQLRNFGGSSDAVEIERIRQAEREKDRLWSAVRAGGTNDELLRGSVDHIADAHKRAVDVAQADAAASHRAVERKDEELTKLRMEMMQLQGDASRAKGLETEIIALRARYEEDGRNVRDKHAEEIRYLRDRHSDELKRLSDDHKQTLDRLHQEQRDALMREQSRYHENQQREQKQASEKVEQLRLDEQRRVDDLNRAHERELASMRDTNQRELNTLRDAHARELNSIRESQGARVMVAEEGNKHRQHFLEQEITRLRADNDRLRTENDQMRDKLHKDPVTLLRESREMAKMTGMVDKEDAAPAGEPFDIKREITSGLKTLFDKGPEIVRAVRGNIEAQQHAAAAAAGGGFVPHQMPPGVMRTPQGLPPGQGAPAQRRPQRPAWIEPQRGPQPFGASPVATPMGAPAGVPRPPNFVPPPPAPPTQQAHPTHAPAGTSPPAQPIPQPATLAALQQATAVEQAPASNGPPGEGPSQEAVGAFLDQLGDAIDSGMIPPQVFAQAMLEQLMALGGPPLIQRILGSPIEKLFEYVDHPKAPPKWRAIATHAGQNYVREVWAIAINIVNTPPPGASPAAPAAPPQEGSS